jgi:three-Cys-motif partner protein
MMPPDDNDPRLIGEDDLQAMLVEITSARSMPRARDLVTDVREFHGWTLNKLEVFEQYLKLYRRVAGNGTFIDAFAGTGQGVLIRDGEELKCDGSSLVAAKSGAFSRIHLIEKETRYVEQLRDALRSLTASQSSKVQLHHGDCNELIPALFQDSDIDQSRPCFVLLDQESTQLNWETVAALAAWKTYDPPATNSGRPKTCKVELWILFNSHQVINRLWPNDHSRYPDSFSPDTLDRVFGGREAWRDLREQRQPFGALTNRYAKQLLGLGYQYVHPQLIVDPATERPQYYMIHATDHPSAVSFMRWAKRSVDRVEKLQLPGLEA